MTILLACFYFQHGENAATRNFHDEVVPVFNLFIKGKFESLAIVCPGDIGYREVMDVRGMFPFHCYRFSFEFGFYELFDLVRGNLVRVGNGCPVREFIIIAGIYAKAAFLKRIGEGQHFHLETESREVGGDVTQFIQRERHVVSLSVFHPFRRGEFYGITVVQGNGSLYFRGDLQQLFRMHESVVIRFHGIRFQPDVNRVGGFYHPLRET